MHTIPAVALRPLTSADAAVLADWAADDTFVAHAGWTPGLAWDEHERFWLHRIIADPPPELLRLGVEHEGALIGYVDLYGTRADERELGYVIGPSTRWGQGLGKAAARAGLAYGFDSLALASIWAEALPLNAPSVRILEGIGMRHTGRGDEASFLGVRSHYEQYRITREQYEKIRADPSTADARADPGTPAARPPQQNPTAPG